MFIRRRLPRTQREQQIVEEAIRFFAECGLDGQTRALAERLGVTQPLLYRYFPDKDSLIKRVFHDAFVGAWNPQWDEMIADRSRPLTDRLIDFYHIYVHMNFGYERMRLFMYAGLKDQAFAHEFLTFIRQRLFIPLAMEFRAAAGLTDLEPTDDDIEQAAALHGAVVYVCYRNQVFRMADPADPDQAIRVAIRTMIAGATATLRGE